ncbi:MAG: glycosyltransferase family 2 protein [Anaerolineales bacterium]|nr:glycosyltransferase family 2 protein [Anaerolineales bacterium]
MSIKPILSVVVATHNRANLLPRSLESIISQQMDDTEIIIVDDGSQDNTQEVITTLKRQYPNIRSFQNSVAKGPGAARNLGIRMAQGDFIAIMDDDDFCAPDRFKRQLAVFEDAPDVGLCFGVVEWVDDDNRPLGQFPGLLIRQKFPTDPHEAFLYLLLNSNKIPNVTVMARRELLFQFPYAEDVKIGEDWYMVLNILAMGHKVVGLPIILVYQSRSFQRNGLMQQRDRAIRDQRRVLKRVFNERRLPKALRLHALSKQLTREARMWSGLQGIRLSLWAMCLWPLNGDVYRNLGLFMLRAIQRLKRMAIIDDKDTLYNS